MTTTADTPAPAVSAEARRLITLYGMHCASVEHGRNYHSDVVYRQASCDAADRALSAHIAALEAEVARLRDAAQNQRHRAQDAEAEVMALSSGRFVLGNLVRKVKGSFWHGRVVGFYSTALTPIGYAVESERELGSVQIYPEAALEMMPEETPDAE